MSEWVTVAEIKDMGWEPDQYGNVVLSVKFSEHLKGAMLRVQKRPEIGDKLYGHFEPTKTGNGQWFKKDKLPDGEYAPTTASIPTVSGISNSDILTAIQALHADLHKYMGGEADQKQPSLLGGGEELIDMSEIPF